MLSPVRTLAHRVNLYLRRPISLAAYDVARASDDERPFLNQTFLLFSSEDEQSDFYTSSGGEGSSLNQTSLVYSSEDGQSDFYTSSWGELPSLNEISEEEDLQLVSLIQTATAQTSTYGSFIIDRSVRINQTNLPVASGALADVYKCILNRGATREEVAVKSPRFLSLADAAVAQINHNLDREITIWARLDHQYVLCLYGTVIGFGQFRALVSPWMPNGTLNSYLAVYLHETLTTMDRLRILVQITEGLKYLHDNNVIHGDLTSNNILVDADGSPRIAGFGVSNVMVESKPAFPYQTGAVRWAAPELIVFHDGETWPCATKSSDIYALGCIMLQVLYNKPPYWWIKTNIHVMTMKFKYQEPINDTMQIQAYYLDFMRRCWSVECEKRPSVEEVLDFLDEAISIGAPL